VNLPRARKSCKALADSSRLKIVGLLAQQQFPSPIRCPITLSDAAGGGAIFSKRFDKVRQPAPCR